MEIISTNIGKPQFIEWQGDKVKTGIYKQPDKAPIFLGLEDVEGDHVIDRKHHGGTDKACYLFSELHYDYWKKLFPELKWQWGMFGENLTISNMNESNIRIGDIFSLGDAIFQVSQPRQPCFKLGVRLGSQKAITMFIKHGYPGIYVRIIKPGYVKTGDIMELSSSNNDCFTIREIFQMIYNKNMNPEKIKKAIGDNNLAESCRNDLKRIWRI